MRYIKGIGLAIMLAVLHVACLAQTQPIIEKYIKIGLDSNLALQRKSFDLEKARLDLKRAEALFLPQVGFNAQYTLATGGRTEQIPVGTLLNGVYSTLNQLTNTNTFPQIKNETIQFLPNDFHDTKIELTMPVFNKDLQYNKAIKTEMINGQKTAINLYKRELVKQIKQAYFQYQQAGKAINIYQNALSLVNENLRFSEKLVKNNVATKEIVSRAKAQVSQVTASLYEAENNRKNAAAYFNYLLNQSLETPIQTDSTNTEIALIQQQVQIPTNREELLQLNTGKKILEKSLRLNEAYKLPKLNAFYNIGYQGFGYTFSNAQFFQLGGLQLQWNIFKGNDNKYKIKQTIADIAALNNQYSEAEKQIMLQSATAFNTYKSLQATLNSIKDEVESNKETYRLIEKKYKEGQALQIELIDARTQLTNAEIRLSLAYLAVQNQAAELERINATYPIQ
jgi:outer membrane protein TolC